jgi:hypothetical protein
VIVRGLLQYETTVSRRALLGGLASVASLLALGGCAGVDTAGARYDASSLSSDPTLLITTTRKPVNDGRAKPWFGPERASTMTVARAKLVPPDGGRFSLAAVGLAPDWRLDGVERVSGEVGDLLAQAGGGGDVLIYVHGFNQTFETAALDAAHLADGINFHGRTIMFSWPSKAGLFDYAYDRDSAMYSRDGFERVLSSIVSAPSPGRVHIVAHSMGTMLALEACVRSMRAMATPLSAGSAPWCSPRLISTWMCSRRRSPTSVRSLARSPSSLQRTIARWRCRGDSLAG